jgi:hypothetical protein
LRTILILLFIILVLFSGKNLTGEEEMAKASAAWFKTRKNATLLTATQRRMAIETGHLLKKSPAVVFSRVGKSYSCRPLMVIVRANDSSRTNVLFIPDPRLEMGRKLFLDSHENESKLR